MCIRDRPNSSTEAAGVARPVSFFVDVGGRPVAAGGPPAAVQRKTSSASVRTTPQDVDPGRTGRHPVPRSASSPNAASGMPPDGVGTRARKTIGQRLHRALQKFSTKVPCQHACYLVKTLSLLVFKTQMFHKSSPTLDQH